ncbi:MAG: hypothetical protein K5705_13065 [Oscillospiraceae bacterium]|nr:hypothetical protein [Oscillospiraceae bacterium]
MTEFILEDQICNVKNARTRDYLREIVSTYQHGDYRSCIVTLYVVTVYDLLERIRILDVMYGNSEAHRFMEDFKRKTAPGVDAKYSDLEKEIIQEATNLQILTDIGKRKVEELRTLRHDCAHPSIDAAGIGAAELYMPNRDEVRAKIRTMFELLFLKDPSVMKTVLNGFDADLLQVYQAFGEEKLPDYLLKTYYKRMTADEKKRLLYSPLWYKTFLEDKPESDGNRRAYYIAMRTLIRSDKDVLVQYMCENPDKFSGDTLKKRLLKDIADEPDAKKLGRSHSRLVYISGLAFHFPDIVKGWTDDIRTVVENWNNLRLARKWRAYCFYQSLEEHAAALKAYAEGVKKPEVWEAVGPVRQMYEFAAERGAASLYHPVVKAIFFSDQFATPYLLNGVYYAVLAPAIPYMDEENLLDLVNRCKAHPVIPACPFYEDAFLPGIRELAEEKHYSGVLAALTEKKDADSDSYKETLASEIGADANETKFQTVSAEKDGNRKSDAAEADELN